jgi:hypothetical protein
MDEGARQVSKDYLYSKVSKVYRKCMEGVLRPWFRQMVNEVVSKWCRMYTERRTGIYISSKGYDAQVCSLNICMIYIYMECVRGILR